MIITIKEDTVSFLSLDRYYVRLINAPEDLITF